MRRGRDSGPAEISVIIPALNEEGAIVSTLESVARGQPREIIVADGGSADKTRALASAFGARVISNQAGRARQMNAGAAKAGGNLLLFLHADTLPPRDWSRLAIETLRPREVAAGAFGFAIAGDLAGKRILEWATNRRSHWCQMPYGDQGLFLRREIFEEEGGFADLPIMEDYELVRRLRRRGRIVTVAGKAFTSGRRWQRLGIFKTTLLNRLMILGYRGGVRPERLAGLYRKAGARRGGTALE